MIPSTYLGLSSVPQFWGPGCSGPWSRCLLQLGVLVIRLQRLHLLLTVALLGLFHPLRKAANAERHTHTHT